MMKEEKCEKVPLNLLIPKELDREWREYVQKKYDIPNKYHLEALDTETFA